ncbi:MAG: hypothetical protein Q8859_05625 [Bacteroidota bacterium]|nr:hypothetical protein [Bacteroidota bacterium]
MNNKLIIEFILREISDLETMVRSLSEEEDYSPLLVDIAVTKAKNLYQEVLLLSEKNPLPSSDTISDDQKGLSNPDLKGNTISPDAAEAENEPLNLSSFHLDLIPQDEEEYPLEEEDQMTEGFQHLPYEEYEESSSDSESESINNESVEDSETSDSFESKNKDISTQPDYNPSIPSTETQTPESNTVPAASDQTTSKEEELPKEESESKEKAASFYSKEQTNQDQSVNDFFSEEKDLKTGIRFPIQDLHSAIGLNDQYLFIRELFNNDADFYNRSIAYINSCTSIHEAVEFMKENFRWKKNDASKRFLELVKRRFS